VLETEEFQCTEEAYPNMQAKLTVEPVITEADKMNDRRSLRRCTQGYLYLMLQDGQDKQGLSWRLPRIPVTDSDASIRNAALRCLRESMGDTMESFLLGNAPAAHLCSADERTFFMLGVVLDGLPELQKGSRAKDLAWMTRAEVLEAYSGDEKALEMIRLLLVE
jgi:large subunit ribosomal protein L46